MEGLESIDELMEDAMSLQLRDVLHADDMRLQILDESSEMMEQAPLFIGGGVEALSIPREGLARRTSDQNTPAVMRVQGRQFFARDVGDALLLEGGWPVVVLVWVAALPSNIIAGNDMNTRIEEAASETAGSAEQVNCRNARRF